MVALEGEEGDVRFSWSRCCGHERGLHLGVFVMIVE